MHNKKLISFLTNVLLTTFIFYSGCSSSGGKDTVDGSTLEDDYKDIQVIYSFKIKDGRQFSKSNDVCNIYIQKSGSTGLKIFAVCDSIDAEGYRRYTKVINSFSLSDVTRANVLYKKSSSPVGIIIGVVVFIGLLAFLFWASGERNKRE
jgi:hypothetical protein